MDITSFTKEDLLHNENLTISCSNNKCGKILQHSKKYIRNAIRNNKPYLCCSRKCSSIVRLGYDPYITFSCITCNVSKTVLASSSYGKYCSIKCMHKNNLQRHSIRVESGNAGPDALKQYLIRHKGYSCNICTISTWEGKKLSLQLDHIDGDSSNNRIENGRLLCPNCHSQTSTFTGRNVKNTKRNRYLRNYKSIHKQGNGRG